MGERFFIDSRIVSDQVTLRGPEAHHLIHVMRAQVGTEITLFDGEGAEFPARVARLHRAAADLEILQRRDVDREHPLRITLGVALPKGDRQRWLVEKCVELGVYRLLPLETARGVAQPTEQALARLRRVVIEASKQCGRNRLMEIGSPGSVTSHLVGDASSVGLIAHPVDASGREPPQLPRLDAGTSVQLAVGPEGGFTPEELAAARAAGWSQIDLGARLLRVETAALALVSAITFARR